MTVTVNAAPIADAGPALTVAPGEELVLDAETSVDPDGRIAAHVWTFYGSTGKTGERVAHRLTAPGLLPVAVITDDGRALANSLYREEVYARVNALPVADAGPDRTVCPGDPVVFRAGAYDADGQITRVLWEFLDGVTLEGAEVSRSFDNTVAVDVTLRAMDDSGATFNAGTDRAATLTSSWGTN